MRRFWAMAAIMVLAGCAGADPEKLARFQSGKTTLGEVIASLGSPDRDETLPDGSRMLIYVEQRASPKVVNFIPGANSFAGGWNVRSAEAGLMFSPDGVLRFHAWSDNAQARMRMAGQAVSPHAAKPAAESPPEKQDPPPVSGQGAEPSQPHSAD